MTDTELTIALLDIKHKIAACRVQESPTSPWLLPTTLRHKAEELAAAYVDPSWVADEEGTTE